MISGFNEHMVEANGQTIACSTSGGTGPAVLLLHGFPQTRAMWHSIAPALAERFTVVAADLRGYGASSKPSGTEPYRFRHMAQDMATLMAALGHDRFHLVGHDRGARVAHRLALDHGARVASLTLMDIVPTHLLLTELRHEVARAYYHWFFLAQPYPKPERMIGADPDAYFESLLGAWGPDGLAAFHPDALAAYRAAWRLPDTIRGMCADYRAALDHDVVDDAEDLGRRVDCPALVLYGANGIMARQFDVPGTWADRLAGMRSAAIPGGHFFPDTAPVATTEALLAFLGESEF
ncbi:MAG: alpha/beta hydrolase [Pseudomonadota bacterium]